MVLQQEAPTMKITAAVVAEKGGSFSLEEVELEEPRDDEILVRIVAAGICHTDLTVRDEFYGTPLPAVLGHEGSGVVERVGSKVSKVKPGDRVVLTYNSCGTCINCQHGDRGYCDEFYARNFAGVRDDESHTIRQGGRDLSANFFGQSSFATHSLANEENIVKLPSDLSVPLEQLGPLGCGLQTGMGAVINALRPKAGSGIALFGTGAVGMAALMGAKIVGCAPIIAVDIIPNRLELARELGATHTINPTETDPVEEIQKISGSGVLYSVESTCNQPPAVRQAVDSLALTGICGQLGTSPLGTEMSLDMNNILFGRTIRGIILGDSIPDDFIPKMINMHLDGQFPFDKLIKFYSFDQINEAVKDSEEGRTIKSVLRMP
jgi:aryl-alcohol dehydrogenase